MLSTKWFAIIAHKEKMEAILSGIGNETLQFRLAAAEDCQMLWEWTNDPEIRRSSFSSDPIPWETHEVWFNRMLTEENCLFLIILENGKPAGQLRFRIDRLEAVISVSLTRGKRGMGLGSNAIKMASRYLFQIAKIDVIHAFIKPDNTASIRSFVKAGYIFFCETKYNDHPALDYIFSLDQSQE